MTDTVDTACTVCGVVYRGPKTEYIKLCPTHHDGMSAAVGGNGKDPGREHREKAETEGERR